MNIIDVLFNRFPRQFGEKRTIVKNKDDFYNKINRYNGKIANCFTNVYDIIDEIFIIDKIFLDLDKEKTCWVSTKKLHKYLLEKNLKHCIMFSGGGFHVYIFTKNGNRLNYPKNAVRETQKFIAKENSLEIGKPKEKDIDEHIIGNAQQLVRIPYTFNGKEDRRRFCIPLIEKLFELEYNDIKLIAKGQYVISKTRNCLFGTELFDLKPFDIKPDIEYIKLDEGNIEVNKINIDSQLKRLLPFIRNLLLNCKCGWRDRYYTVLGMKELGFPLQLCIEICRKHWTPDKFAHAMRDERQIEYIYRRNDLFFPRWETIEREGYHVTNEDKKFKFYKEK